MTVGNVPRATDGQSGRPFRFLVLVDFHTGHVVAASGVVQRLQARGHEVRVVCPSSSGVVRFAMFGIEAEAITEISGEMLDDATSRSAVRRELGARIEAAAEAIARFGGEGWDLALVDPFLLWIYPWLGKFVRCVSLCTKPDLGPDPNVPPWTSKVIPGDGLGMRARVRTAWLLARYRYLLYQTSCAISEVIRGVSHRSLTRAAIAHAGHSSKDLSCRPIAIDMRFSSVPELVLHAREFDFPRRASGGYGALHIGPCIPKRSANRQNHTGFQGPSPLVYCTFGTETLARDRMERYQAVIAAITMTGWRGLVSTADAELARRLRQECRGSDDKIQVVEWVDSPSVLRAASVIVNHGGANSTKEAIAAGCPIVAMPMRADQPGIAARVAYHGLGILGASRDPARLATAIALAGRDSGIRRNVERMSAIFGRYDRECIAERTLEQMCADAREPVRLPQPALPWLGEEQALALRAARVRPPGAG